METILTQNPQREKNTFIDIYNEIAASSVCVVWMAFVRMIMVDTVVHNIYVNMCCDLTGFSIASSDMNPQNSGIPKMMSYKVINDGCLTESSSQGQIQFQIGINLVGMTTTLR